MYGFDVVIIQQTSSFLLADTVDCIQPHTAITMGKGKQTYVFEHQLKTLVNIRERIDLLVQKHGELKGGVPGVLFRTAVDPHSPTLYQGDALGKRRIVQGVREGDYLFSESDPSWIQPSDEHGLSFSSSFNQVKFTLDLLGKFQKKGTKINVAYWILESSIHIPEDMAFVQDPKNAEHYLLVVKKRMLVTTLVEKLTRISQRMTIMNDLQLEAFKE